MYCEAIRAKAKASAKSCSFVPTRAASDRDGVRKIMFPPMSWHVVAR